MCDLSSNANNTPKKLQGWNNRSGTDIGNTIEYDVKSYQVKTNLLQCTKVWLNGLDFNGSQKEMLV